MVGAIIGTIALLYGTLCNMLIWKEIMAIRKENAEEQEEPKSISVEPVGTDYENEMLKRYETILSNIDTYNGTAAEQREVV